MQYKLINSQVWSTEQGEAISNSTQLANGTYMMSFAQSVLWSTLNWVDLPGGGEKLSSPIVKHWERWEVTTQVLTKKTQVPTFVSVCMMFAKTDTVKWDVELLHLVSKTN